MRNFVTSAVLLLLLFSSCKKDAKLQEENSVKRLNTLVEVKSALMKTAILMAKTSPEFKKAVETECLRQVRGDYNVALDRLIELVRIASILPVGDKALFVSLVNQM